MKKRLGTKVYDTEKATLIETRSDGIQVFRKKGRSAEFFRYDPNAKAPHDMFRDLPADQAVRYLPENTKSKAATNSGNTLRFRPYDLERIRQHATRLGIPANRFVMMLVDEYEQEQKGE